MNITVYCGSNKGTDPAFEQEAVALGLWIAENGHTLVYGGGNIGLMGILADVVLDHGGAVIGVIPEFLIEHEHGHTGLHTLEVVPDMSTRKARMLELGDVYIAMPGGPGTLEEISEAISHMRLLLHDCTCVFLNINGYYDLIHAAYRRMVEYGFMPEEQYDKILFVNTVKEIADRL
ncbi:MAG: TIGR00730 family Rossman fold protein [Mogibacterium sp.]|nr:TIGR00730 family Rossman fold protein [Mogibacterium sp.]